MTYDFSALTRDAQDAAAPIILAQLNLKGRDPENGYRKAGLPTQSRVMVVIGYQGCAGHDFIALEKKAVANNATLYVINGNPDAADAATPVVNVKENGVFRPLNGKVYTPRNTAGKLMNAEEILALANDFGLSAKLDGQGTKTVTSTGEKLFENGKPIDLKKTAEISRASAARG